MNRQSLAKLQLELKASVNQKLGTSYKTITQFKKHFGLNSNDATWEYLDEFDRKDEMKITYIKKPKTIKKVKPSEKVIKKGLETEKYFKEKDGFTKRPVILFSIDFQNEGKEYQYGDLDEIWNKKFKPVLNRLFDLYKNGYWQIDFIGLLLSKNGTEGRKKSLEALLIDKSSYNSIYKQLREFLYQYVLQGEKLILLEIDIKVIKPLSGGCYSCPKGGVGKNIKIDNLTLYNPYSNNNNCLFRLIEKDTEFKMTKTKCNEIRKEFKIKPNEMVDLINADLICKKYCKKSVSFITNNLDVICGDENGEMKILFLDNHFLLLTGETKRCLDCGKFYIHKHKCNGKMCNFYNQKVLKRLIAKVDRKDKGLLNKEILHYDIETHYNNSTREHTPYVVGYCYYLDGELKYEVICGEGCMKRFYDLLGSDKFENVKYLNAFNGSNFDHYYLFRVKMEENKKIGKFILNNGSLLNADIQGKRLMDLAKHLTGSLSSNLKQNGCHIAKGSIDHNLSTNWETTDEVRKKDVLEYLKCDVLGLCELYEKVNEPIYSQFQINLCECLTTSSSAFTIWRDKFLNQKIYLPDNEMENNIRQAIYGGRCYKNKNRFFSNQYEDILNGKISYDEIDDYIFDADVVSLYPTAMLEKFPVGKEIKTNLYQDNKMGIYKIKYVAPKNLLTPILPRKEDGRLKWDLRDGEGWYSSVDIENAKEKGYEIEVITGYYWNETDYVFKEYIEEFYKMKQNSKKGTPAYTTAKLYLNGLYGKMIQRAINSKDAIISTSEEFLEILNKNIIQEINEVNDKWLIKYIPKEEYLNPSGAEKPTQLGIFILAYSRRIMNGYYDKCGNSMNRLPYYYDTDSLNIHSSCLDKIKINKNLGGIDDDVGGKVIRAIYIAPKMYALQYITEDNKIHYHFRGKGVSNDVLNWKDFEDMDKGASKKYYRDFQMKKINLKKTKKDAELNHFSHKHILGEDTGKVVNNIKWSGRNFIDENNSVPYGFLLENICE